MPGRSPCSPPRPRAAGPQLNRRTFVTALSKVKNFQGTTTPVLSFSATKHYGPTQYKIVRLHNNVPPSSRLPAHVTGQGPGHLLGDGDALHPASHGLSQER